MPHGGETYAASARLRSRVDPRGRLRSRLNTSRDSSTVIMACRIGVPPSASRRAIGGGAFTIRGRPAAGRAPTKGIDRRTYFHVGDGKTRQIILSVKAGHVSPRRQATNPNKTASNHLVTDFVILSLQWCRVGSLVPSKTLLLPGVLPKGAGGDHRVRALSLRPLRWKGDLHEHPCWYPTAKAGLETVFCCAYGR